MDTEDLAFKFRLRFNICCMASEARRLPQVDEDASVLYHRSMCHIIVKLEDHLTSGSDHAVADGEGNEEIFRIALELPDEMPDKADRLDDCGARFSKSFLRNNNQKEDLDKCILARQQHGYG
jgi:hypothetical protein